MNVNNLKNCHRCNNKLILQHGEFICSKCGMYYWASQNNVYIFRLTYNNIIDNMDLLVWVIDHISHPHCLYYSKKQDTKPCKLPMLPFDISADKLKTYLLLS